MRLRWGLESFVVGVIAVGCLTGCSEREEERSMEEAVESSEGGPQAVAPAAQTRAAPVVTEVVEVPAATSAPLESFLERRVRMRPIAAGQEIGAFFASWEEMLKRRSREPVDVHFEVETEGTFGKEHRWTASTNRGILDELAREYDLAWTIAEPNTIRITKEGAS